MPPELPQRRSIRLKGYDIAQAGAYFVTICTQVRLHLFGRIADGVVHPSPIGEWAQRCWDAIPQHMPHVDVHEFVVMPNHVHGIVVIRERLVGVRGDARGVGARHDAPGIGAGDAPGTNAGSAPGIGAGDAPGTNAGSAPGIGAGDAQGNTDDTSHTIPVDPGNGMPAGDPDMADAHGPHTRARHDASLRDPRKPPGIPRGALGQIVASYKSAVTRMAYRDGLLPVARPCGNGIIGTTSFGVMAHTNASRNTSATTPPIGGRTGSIGEHQGRRVVVESTTACGGRGCIRHGWYGV